ncbi:MAG: hypothetical protein IKJ68_10410 [Clostridia bacterium]|nr:hypothetical protein [Clostridia bacterium]
MFRETELFLAYGAALIHECAHGLVAYLLGIKPKGVKVNIFGVKLLLPYVTNSTDKILVWSAGPVASFSLGVFLFILGDLLLINSAKFNFFVFANFVIGLANLLPVFPLDGSVILKSVVARYSGIIKAAKTMHFFENVVCFCLGLICIFLCVGKVFNPSLWAMAIFLLINKNKESSLNITEKKMVLSGEVKSEPRLKYMACHTDSELLCLAEKISADYTLIVAAFCDDKFVCDLNQNDIICGINKYGALCTIDKYIKGNLSLCLTQRRKAPSDEGAVKISNFD